MSPAVLSQQHCLVDLYYSYKLQLALLSSRSSLLSYLCTSSPSLLPSVSPSFLSIISLPPSPDRGRDEESLYLLPFLLLYLSSLPLSSPQLHPLLFIYPIPLSIRSLLSNIVIRTVTHPGRHWYLIQCQHRFAVQFQRAESLPYFRRELVFRVVVIGIVYNHHCNLSYKHVNTHWI